MDPRPCQRVDELWEWQPPGGSATQKQWNDEEADDGSLPCHPVAVPPIWKLKTASFPKRQPQFLVCHDYKGDFPPCDRWEGCTTSECAPFIFTHLWHIDTLVYFGHKFVTIPPAGYTSVAHRHGVRVLGTLIFEHDEGKETMSSILGSSESMDRTVAKLVEVMRCWQFDGWLVNVEIEMEQQHELDQLPIFLRRLTDATAAANPVATVIWYDAVCTDGKLEWQNKLCDRNREFYNACDGIFLNYAWKMDDLESCNKFHRGPSTICAGVDVWGRSGGNYGWDTCETVRKVQKKNLSIALFAPGWAVEAHEDSPNGAIRATPDINSFKFWSTLNPLFDTNRCLEEFPFKTTFRNGFSEDGKFFRMRDTELQAHLALSRTKQLLPTGRGLIIREPGRHVLWRVVMPCSASLRVRIRVEGAGSASIFLDRRQMELEKMEEDNSLILKPSDDEFRRVSVIYVSTSEPDILLTYFEAYKLD